MPIVVASCTVARDDTHGAESGDRGDLETRVRLGEDLCG